MKPALLLLLVSMGVHSMEAAPASVPSALGLGLAGMELRLDEALKSLGPDGSAPDFYAETKGKLRETQTLVTQDPKSPDRPLWERACSLYVEAALLEIQGLASRRKRAVSDAARIAVLSELSASLDEINRLERGYASTLLADLEEKKRDLEEQKRKVKEAREEAEKRFNELNSALIQVKKDARGTIISMSDILFDIGKADLTEQLKTSLAKIAGILTIYKDAKITVEGHTDNQGGQEYNQKLSEMRAKNVMNFMLDPGGISAQRLSSVGYGFSKPVSENDTKEGRQKNRRVDLVISDAPATKGP